MKKPNDPPAAMPSGWRLNFLRLLALLLVISLSLGLLTLREEIQQLAAYGYPGVFLLALLANATVLVPAPGVAVVFTMGSILHPLGVALAAGVGAALGELSGYLAGFSGQAVIERMDLYTRVKPYVQRYGMVAIIILAAIPNPVFDLVGIAAGVLKMKLWQFLLAAWIGQTVKMTLFAYAGALSLTWLLD